MIAFDERRMGRKSDGMLSLLFCDLLKVERMIAKGVVSEHAGNIVQADMQLNYDEWEELQHMQQEKSGVIEKRTVGLPPPKPVWRNRARQEMENHTLILDVSELNTMITKEHGR